MQLHYGTFSSPHSLKVHSEALEVKLPYDVAAFREVIRDITPETVTEETVGTFSVHQGSLLSRIV
jgi:hypothetical protein